jgi:hypothetical protein
MDENSERLWKMRNLFQILYRTFSKFYNPSKQLAVGEVTFLFKAKVVSKQIAKETQTYHHANIQTMQFQ